MPSQNSAPVVLVVDDEQPIASTLAAVLRQLGFIAVAAHSAEDAVRIAQGCAPDCLVSDIVMGAMTGIEAAIHIRALCPDCRIILMTGNMASAELLDSARERGFHFDVLARPFHPSVLLQKLTARAEQAKNPSS